VKSTTPPEYRSNPQEVEGNAKYKEVLERAAEEVLQVCIQSGDRIQLYISMRMKG
jgi:hypothetical protein